MYKVDGFVLPNKVGSVSVDYRNGSLTRGDKLLELIAKSNAVSLIGDRVNIGRGAIRHFGSNYYDSPEALLKALTAEAAANERKLGLKNNKDVSTEAQAEPVNDGSLF